MIYLTVIKNAKFPAVYEDIILADNTLNHINDSNHIREVVGEEWTSDRLGAAYYTIKVEA